MTGTARAGSENGADAFDLVVVGGGVAGLVAARRAAAAGSHVVVLEASDRPGGMLRRDELRFDNGDAVIADLAGGAVSGAVGPGAAGVVAFDIGAEAFAVRGGTVERYLGELGLADEVVAPEARGSWGFADGEAYRLPKTGLLGIPAYPTSPDVRAALGPREAARASQDSALTPDVGTTTQSLADLARVRMGDAVVDRLVGPVARGVYSTDPELLDHRRIAPGLVERIATAGTLGNAVAEVRAAAPPGAAVSGLRGGMWRLVDALLAELERLGVEVRTDARVKRLEHEFARASADDAARAPNSDHGCEWLAHLAGGGSVCGGAVLLTVDPGHDIEVDGLTDADAGGRRETRPAITPAEVVALLVDAPELDVFPRGTGVLVGTPPGDVSAKALTHVTAKWSWLAERVPRGWHVLRLSYGPPRPTAAERRAGVDASAASDAGPAALSAPLDDDALAELALHDAGTLLGVRLERTRLRAFARHTWRMPYPAARIGRAQALDAVRETAAGLTGFGLAGTWIDGTGLATVIPGAERAADALIAR